MSALALPGRRRLVWRRVAGSLFVMGLVLVVGFVTVYPILAIVGNGIAVSQAGHVTGVGLNAWRGVFAQPGTAQAMVNTLKVVGTVQLISFPIAILVSWLVA